MAVMAIFANAFLWVPSFLTASANQLNHTSPVANSQSLLNKETLMEFIIEAYKCASSQSEKTAVLRYCTDEVIRAGAKYNYICSFRPLPLSTDGSIKITGFSASKIKMVSITSNSATVKLTKIVYTKETDDYVHFYENRHDYEETVYLKIVGNKWKIKDIVSEGYSMEDRMHMLTIGG